MISPERITGQETEPKPQILFGTYFPKTVLTNEEIASWKVKTNRGRILTAEDIKDKTGVVQRFVADDAETVLSMGAEAAKPIIDKVGGFFDFVIFSTTYPVGEHLSRKVANSIIGVKPFNTLDVHAACSGLVYAFNHIWYYQDWFLGRRVLMIAAEKISPTLPNLQDGDQDPSLLQTIFSDGATAVSFVYGKDLKIFAIRNHEFNLEESQALRMPVDYDLIPNAFMNSRVKFIWSPPSDNGKVFMNGRAVYEAVVRKVPSLIIDTIFDAGLTPSDIDLVIPHQASRHMLDGIGKRLPQELQGKLVYDLEDGNFSSAAIPKAWMKITKEGRIKSGNKVVLVAVGAGLFASIAVVEIV